MIQIDASLTTDEGVGRLPATLSAWYFSDLLLQNKKMVDVGERRTDDFEDQGSRDRQILSPTSEVLHSHVVLTSHRRENYVPTTMDGRSPSYRIVIRFKNSLISLRANRPRIPMTSTGSFVTLIDVLSNTDRPLQTTSVQYAA